MIAASCKRESIPFSWKEWLSFQEQERGFRRGFGVAWLFYFFVAHLFLVLEIVEWPGTFSLYGKAQAAFVEQASSVPSPRENREMAGKGL